MTNTQARPILLWVAAAYWVLSGVSGLVPIFMAAPMFSQMTPGILLFVLAAALSHVLSLLGAILLVRRKQSAIALLGSVFVLGAVTLLATGKSPTNMSTFTVVLWAIGASTVAYAMFLRKKGVLA